MGGLKFLLRALTELEYVTSLNWKLQFNVNMGSLVTNVASQSYKLPTMERRRDAYVSSSSERAVDCLSPISHNHLMISRLKTPSLSISLVDAMSIPF